MTYIDEQTGDKVVTRRMNDYVRSLPSFKMWQAFVKSRPTHCIIDARGEVRYTCLCCGDLFSHWPVASRSGVRSGFRELWNVRIGAVLRIGTEERLDPTTVERGHKVVPMVKTGIGCVKCVAHYEDAVKRVEGMRIPFIDVAQDLVVPNETE